MRRPLPWQAGAGGRRANEDVRPIFWAHRPKSYISRTASWDDFPNGRWGDSRSPAFGDLTDYHIGYLSATSTTVVADTRKEAWGGELKSVQDAFDTMARFCAGELDQSPWSETRLAAESEMIKDTLIKVNKMGFLTINSQPRVNGAPSTDEKVGWGPRGGYVFQKAYLEFFTSAENLEGLMQASKKFPSLSYHAVNIKGQAFSNVGKPHVTAVTWGVFPNKEIIQPTVVDPDSFIVWKDEAFGLFRSQWALLFDPESSSRKLIDTMIDTYFLVNIVDNNFVDGDIFGLFDEIKQHRTTAVKS